jgi:hypothetical protein
LFHLLGIREKRENWQNQGHQGEKGRGGEYLSQSGEWIETVTLRLRDVWGREKDYVSAKHFLSAESGGVSAERIWPEKILKKGKQTLKKTHGRGKSTKKI